MPQLERPDASVHYEIAGAGPPVLMIAGTASDGASWTPLTERLKDRYTLILPDNRGSGRTRSAGDIRIADIVADHAALIAHLGHEQVAVIGHSLGGYLGLALAEQHPDQVSRLVTMAIGDRLGAKEVMLFGDMADLYFEIAPQKWIRLLYQFLFSERFFADEANVAAAAQASTDYPFRQSPEDFARQVKALGTAGRLETGRIGCPTLAMAGALDILAAPSAVLAGHTEIRRLTSVVIEGAAHSLHWEQPDRVAALVDEFLSA